MPILNQRLLGCAFTIFACFLPALGISQTVKSLTFPSASVSGGSTLWGTVTLSAAAGVGGKTVSLNSSSGAASVAGDITVPSGKTSTTFGVTTIPVATNITATIKASIGSNSKTTKIVVTAPVLTSINLTPTAVAGGNPITGTVSISSPAPSAQVKVILSASSALWGGPKSVSIGPGAEQATFLFAPSQVTTAKTMKVTATTGGKSVSASFTVNPTSIKSLALNPTSLVGGQQSMGTVMLDGPAPSAGVKVALASNQALATVPASVFVSPGLTAASFAIATQAVTTQTPITITAKQGPNSLSSTLTLTLPSISNFSLKSTSLIGGASTTGTVVLNSNAPTAGLTIGLASNQSSVTVPNSLYITGGNNIGTFTISTSASGSSVAAKITATLGATSVTDVLSVNAPSIQTLTLSPTSIIGGNSGSGTITLNTPAPQSGFLVALSSDQTYLTVPQSVTIAAGATSATFSYSTKTVAQITPVNVTATDPNGVVVKTTVSVTPYPYLATSAWPKSRGNSQNTALGVNGVPIGTVKWESYLHPEDLGNLPAPCIGQDGTIYISDTGGSIHAVSPNGTALWSKNFSLYPLSAPAACADGTIYINASDYLYALNPDGSVKWKFAASIGIGIDPAVGPDGTVYVSSNSALYAINPDGTQKWMSNGLGSAAIGFGRDGAMYVTGGNSTLSGFNAGLYSVDKSGNGTLLFQVPGIGFMTSPVIGPDGTIYVGDQAGRYYGVSPQGTQLWSFYTGGVTDPAIGPDGTVYLIQNSVHPVTSILWALTPAGGVKWQVPAPFNTSGNWGFTTVSVGSDGTIYAGSTDQHVYAINPSGTQKWSVAVGGYIYTTTIAIDKDGTLYVQATDGNLYAIK